MARVVISLMVLEDDSSKERELDVGEEKRKDGKDGMRGREEVRIVELAARKRSREKSKEKRNRKYEQYNVV